jgi:hypothetical protein
MGLILSDLIVVSTVVLLTFVMGFLLVMCKPEFFKIPALSLATVSLLYGFVIISMVSIWGIYFEVTSILFTLIVVGLLLLSFAFKSFTSWSEWRIREIKVRVDTRIALLVAAFSIIPQVSNQGILSLGVRLGPDAFGYGIASQAIGNGDSLSSIEGRIAGALSYGDVATSLSARVQSLYMIPSWTDQITAEFLLGAKRWGIIGHQSVFVEIFGNSSIWKIQASLAALAILLSTLIVRDLLRAHKIPTILSVFAIIGVGTSPLILNSLHEGGVAQIYTLPLISLLGFLLLKKENISFRQEIFLYCAICCSLMASYNDALLLLVLTVFIFIFIRFIQGDQKQVFDLLERFSISFLISLLLALPVLDVFARIFTARSEDGGQAGWAQPRWLSAFDLLGLSNPFGNPSAVEAGTYLVPPVLSLIASIGALIVLFRKRLLTKETALFVSYSSVMLAVYIKTREIDEVSNYQFTKAAATMSPLLWVSLTLALGAYTHLIRKHRTFNFSILVLTLFCVFASATWQSDWRNVFQNQGLKTSWIVDKRFTDYEQEKLNMVFASYDFLQANNSRSVAAASLSNFHFINRGINGKPVVVSVPRRKIGFLFDEFNCPNLTCVDNIPNKDFAFKSNSVAVIHLGDNADILSGMSASSACEYAQMVFWIKWDMKMENCRL